MPRAPVFVGSFIFGLSLLVESFAILGNQFLDPNNFPPDFNYLEALFIYIPAIFAGIGIGLGISGEEDYRNANTALGGFGFAGMVSFTLWQYLQMEFHPTIIPLTGIAISLIAGILAIIGLWIALVAYYGEE
ncbi:MAG: hypothetical protein ACFFD4_00680 [Candidatus Odinarchaeota archaeon]